MEMGIVVPKGIVFATQISQDQHVIPVPQAITPILTVTYVSFQNFSVTISLLNFLNCRL